jgi:hypothetical protein
MARECACECAASVRRSRWASFARHAAGCSLTAVARDRHWWNAGCGRCASPNEAPIDAGDRGAAGRVVALGGRGWARRRGN